MCLELGYKVREHMWIGHVQDILYNIVPIGIFYERQSVACYLIDELKLQYRLNLCKGESLTFWLSEA
jgi:hypothetical protein